MASVFQFDGLILTCLIIKKAEIFMLNSAISGRMEAMDVIFLFLNPEQWQSSIFMM